MDLSRLSDDDLRALSANNLGAMSDAGLKILAIGGQEAPKKKGVGAALGKGVESFLGSAQTTLESPFGASKAAERGLQRGEELGKKYEDQIGLDRLKQAYEQKGLTGAGGELLRQVPLALAEQAPNIAASLGSARLGATAGSMFGPAGALIGGGLGALAPSAMQLFGSNVERQAAEQQQAGQPIDVNVGKAAAATAVQAPLDVAATFIPLGGKVAGKIFGPQVEKLLQRGGTKAAEELAQESFKKTLGKGLAVGAAAEIPTEIAQQMLERAQAGLALTSPDALKEYGETAYQAGLLSPVGGAGRFIDKSGARTQVEEKKQEERRVAQQQAAVEQEQAKAAEEALALGAAQQETGQLFGEALPEASPYTPPKAPSTLTVAEREQQSEQQQATQETERGSLLKQADLFDKQLLDIEKQRDAAAEKGDFKAFGELDTQARALEESIGKVSSALKEMPANLSPEMEMAKLRGEQKNLIKQLQGMTGPSYDAKKAATVTEKLNTIESRLQEVTPAASQMDMFDPAKMQAEQNASLTKQRDDRTQEQADLLAQVQSPKIDNKVIDRYQQGLQDFEDAYAEGADERIVNRLVDELQKAGQQKEEAIANVAGFKSGAEQEQENVRIERIKRAVAEEEAKLPQATTQEDVAVIRSDVAALKSRLSKAQVDRATGRPEKAKEFALEDQQEAFRDAVENARTILSGDYFNSFNPDVASSMKSGIEADIRRAGATYTEAALREINADRNANRQQSLNNDEALKVASAIKERFDFIANDPTYLAEKVRDKNLPILEQALERIKNQVRKGPNTLRRDTPLIRQQFGTPQKEEVGTLAKDMGLTVREKEAGVKVDASNVGNVEQRDLFGEKDLEPVATVRATPQNFQRFVGIQANKFKQAKEAAERAIAEAKERATKAKERADAKATETAQELSKQIAEQKAFVQDVARADQLVSDLRGQATRLWQERGRLVKELKVARKENKKIIQNAIKEIDDTADARNKQIDELHARANELQNANLEREQALLDRLEKAYAKTPEAKNKQAIAAARAAIGQAEATISNAQEKQLKEKRVAEQQALEFKETLPATRQEIVETRAKVKGTGEEIRQRKITRTEAKTPEQKRAEAQARATEGAAERKRDKEAIKARLGTSQIVESKELTRVLDRQAGRGIETIAAQPGRAERKKPLKTGVKKVDVTKQGLKAARDVEQEARDIGVSREDFEFVERGLMFGFKARDEEIAPHKFIEVDGVKRSTENSEGRRLFSTDKEIKNFWRWFGNSKMVDESGRPKVYYHGTNQDFSEYKSSAQLKREGTKEIGYTEGIYFATSSKYAGNYGGVRGSEGANVRPVYLKIDSPKVLEYSRLEKWYAQLRKFKDSKSKQMAESIAVHPNQLAQYVKQGVDGLVNKEIDEVVVFDNDQIAPAIGGLTTQGITKADVNKELAKIKLPKGLKIVVFDRLGGALAEKIQAAGHNPSEVRGGVLPDGTVIFVAENHTDLNDVKQTIAHELIGHLGVENLLGEAGMKALAKQIQKTDNSVFELAKKLGVFDDVLATYANSRRTKSEEDSVLDAVRELIAHTEEATPTKSFLEKASDFIKAMVGAVRASLRKRGLELDINTSDIFKLLRDARKQFNEGSPGAYVNKDNDIMFRVKPAVANAGFEDVLDYSDKIVAKEKSLIDKIKGEATGMIFKTKYIDRFAPIQAVANEMKDSLKATQLMYFLRMHDQRMSFTSEVASSGPLDLKPAKDGKGMVIESTPGANLKDMATALKDADVGNAEATSRIFTMYLAAKRAKRVGLAKLNFGETITQKMLDDTIKAVEGNAATKSAFEKAAGIYAEYNKGLINFAVKTGAIPKDVGAQLTKDGDYVPFYRQRADGSVFLEIGGAPAIKIGNLADQPYLHELVGGDKPIFDVYTSALQNTAMLTDMALRNLATRNTAFALGDMGLLKVGEKEKGVGLHKGDGPKGADTIRFKIDGENYWATVNTAAAGIPSELLVKGLEGVNTSLPNVVKMMNVPANLLRKWVTRNPAYALRQVVRDPLNAVMTTGLDTVPIVSSFKEITKMIRGKSEGEPLLQRRGILGGQVLTGTSEDMTKILRDVTAGKKGWEYRMAQLDQLAIQGDAATRVVMYNNFIKQGLSEMEATLATLESMNFSKRGISPSLFALSTMVPFMNAQIQGLNVIYQAFTGKMPFNEKLKVKQKLVQRALMMAGFSMLYASMMQDDEAYQNANDDEKYGNWFFPNPFSEEHIKVPIPFEMGLLFKAIPEAVINTAFGDEKARDTISAIGKMAWNSIPISGPQGVKPLLEVAINHSFFTGREIESARLQRYEPGERYTERTSEIAKLIGGTLNISPVKLEYLIRGYTGSLPLAVASLANPVLRSSEAGEQPDTRGLLSSETPLVGSFFQAKDASGLVNKAYKDMEEIMQTKQTYEKMVEEGREKEADAYATANADMIAMGTLAGSFRKKMGELIKAERNIRADQTMSGGQKRAELDAVRQDKIALAKEFSNERE
jgi:hypothetical protein